MSKNKRKTKHLIDECDSNSSDDDYFIDNKNDDTSCSETEDDDESVSSDSPDHCNDGSCDESDIPLNLRLEDFRKNLEWNIDGVFNPTVHPFTDDRQGIQSTLDLNTLSSSIEIFKIFCDENFMEMICAATNIYAKNKADVMKKSNKLKKKSRILQFTSVNSDELYLFHALIILMGIIKKPSLSMYWTTDPTLETPFYSKCMHYDRFRMILSCLHFEISEDNDPDVLHKIRPIVDYLIEKFQMTYRPGENIAIDESLLKWRGRLKFKQFNKNKRSRFGVKLYETCESNSGYSYNIQIYAGKDGDDSYVDKRIGISGKVVKQLIGDLNRQGRTLFIDNWYSSPMLFLQLHNEKTNVCGTV